MVFSESQGIERAVDTDAVEPGAKAGTRLEALKLLVRFHKGLLDDVLGIMIVSCHTVRHVIDRSAMPAHQIPKSVHIPGAYLLHDGGIASIHLFIRRGWGWEVSLGNGGIWRNGVGRGHCVSPAGRARRTM